MRPFPFLMVCVHHLTIMTFSDDSHWPFSFVNICVVLGLEPGYLRQGLKQWHQHRSAEPWKRRQRAVPVSRPLKLAA